MSPTTANQIIQLKAQIAWLTQDIADVRHTAEYAKRLDELRQRKYAALKILENGK